jgi:hypothetical protein
MSARQQHGFLYESNIISRLNFTAWEDYVKKYPDTHLDGGYTSTWDAIDESANGFNYRGKPVQIKCIKKGSSVDLGDIFRNASKKENFVLIVGFWEHTKENIVEEYIIHVDYNKWNNLFEWSYYDEVADWIKNKVSNCYSYDAQWKKESTHYKQLWGNDRLINPRFKRDHKNQRRIQCGISYNNFINYIVHEGVVNE